MDEKDIVTAVIGSLGVVVAAVTLAKGFVEYKKQGLAKRAEIFLELRTRLRQDPVFSRICGLLESDSKELADIPLVERDRFVGFFEELALLPAPLESDHRYRSKVTVDSDGK